MSKSIISEGKTTNEAIENGLKKLNVSKNMVDIKILENEEKRSFFSILAPRVVKVQLTVKEEQEKSVKVKKEIKMTEEEQKIAKENIERFLKEFCSKLEEKPEFKLEANENQIDVSIYNGDLGYLIGYRGETLYSLQNVLSSVAGKGIKNRVRVILDIENYKEKREKTLEDLADKIARTVIKTRKSVTLEPMQAYERKIIHSKLQQNSRVETTSIGEEPYRKIVVSLKK